MSYGLMQAGNETKRQAMQGLSASAREENQRNMTNKGIKAQESAAKKTNASAGAATGATIGANLAATSGIAGASVGLSALATGGVGLAAGLILSELF